MHELTLLRDVVLILVVGLVVALALRRIGVPSIAGFILAGIAVGPRALGVVGDVHDVELLAEIGVVLLLFGIGLELSMEKMRRLWKPILLGGSLQVGITLALAAWIATTFGIGWRAGVFVGCLVAVSSTAIVLRGLELRGTIDAPHGRFALGVLVFQDLGVVPMILAVPLLAQSDDSAVTALIALGKAAGVIVGVVLASRLLVPRILHLVAASRQRDLFVLVVLLLCVGTAWVVSLVGVSLALGAFLAGLVVAGSDYRHQAIAELIPLKEVLASLFFVTVGMLLDPRALISDPLPILGLLGAILVGKFVIVVGVGLVLGLPLRVALITGMTLAQAGEFMFVLLRAADGTELVDETLGARLMAAAILSMLVTPLLMYLSPRVAAGVSEAWLFRWLGRKREAPQDVAAPLRNHVIIAGYGVAGEELAEALRGREIPYVVVDLNAETVKLLGMQGEPAYFGDVTSPEVLERLGIHRAAELVVAINDPSAALRAVLAARRLAPELPVLVRVRYVGEVQELLDAGATRVIPSEYESAVEIIARVLSRHGVPPNDIVDHVERMHARYRGRT